MTGMINVKEDKAECCTAEKRQSFLDILRVAATCAVVMLHTITGGMNVMNLNDYPSKKVVILSVMDLVTWSVPVFILISGYLFLAPEKSVSFRQMIGKYCRRIVLALLLFGVPYVGIELVLAERGFRLSMIGEAVLMVLQGKSWSHMWYLYLILLLYLVTPICKWLLERMPRFVLYLIMAVLLWGSSICPFLNKLLNISSIPVLPDEGIYLFYYLAGYLFAIKQVGTGKDIESEKGLLTKNGNCQRAVSVSLILLLAGMVFSRVVMHFSLQMAYNYPFTVLLAVLLFRFAQGRTWQLTGKSMQWWQQMGSLCFGVYLVHPVFANFYYKFLHLTPLDYSIGLSLLCFFIAVLLPAVLLSWLLHRIPILRKYVL